MAKEEAKNTRKPKTPGVRRQRMDLFDSYTRPLLETPDAAVVYEDLDENPQKFVLSLRGAFKRAGVNATVRKMRGRDEVRAWIEEQPAQTAKRGGGRKRA